MTPLDERRLRKLQAQHLRTEVMPSYAELARLLAMASKAAAFKFVARMRQAGYLDRSTSGRIRPGPRFFERRLEEPVRAGSAELEQETVETIDLRAWLHPGADTFLVPVRGDSMEDVGIYDGDVVLARRAKAQAGDIVIAAIDGDVTLKRFSVDATGPKLDPANQKYAARRARRSLEILGVVNGVLRRRVGRALR